MIAGLAEPLPPRSAKSIATLESWVALGRRRRRGQQPSAQRFLAKNSIGP
jgi:hypothetical protein